MASRPPEPERPGHPSGKAALVMVGVVLLIIVLAALSTFT